METGTESEVIYIEPVEIPVPGFAPPAPREPTPNFEPTPETVEAPVEEPVLVPA